ncbi:MAG: hypothetical protein IM585_18485 [Pseudanabaena sp. M135S2SP2A07QC]|nr:hypothetical protein [Pseudanabaena sp. M090S1SP2A07QC]MCA6505463.1 hypothetical protein [Pseudanabaena sp. M172S2SP2A07QC]MCA6523322.1 hypothetical protein [Pseudanabaena sp. M051S1SP2A07QC]MCA6529023.1 hypothetical protein [Pseudanabaena sp. M125S2SP2A07QC]MCA6535365.1 hypothetical protein [Pseudanabaena sp. M176S2SP2A07QC]MCA6538036.1 hypothetical protein [Pseudanabaena sp. M037S2SP2A07QC]MCA6545572.1 hypothetical protein [Pseudanabaena sp. M074S1SP2A07QC]MCA6546097.1 hypothetical prot
MAELRSAIFWVLNCPIYLLRCYILLLRVRTVSMQCDRLGFLRILILAIAPHQKHNEA